MKRIYQVRGTNHYVISIDDPEDGNRRLVNYLGDDAFVTTATADEILNCDLRYTRDQVKDIVTHTPEELAGRMYYAKPGEFFDVAPRHMRFSWCYYPGIEDEDFIHAAYGVFKSDLILRANETDSIDELRLLRILYGAYYVGDEEGDN